MLSELTSSPGLKYPVGTPFPVATTIPEKSRPRIKGNSELAFIAPVALLNGFRVFEPYPPVHLDLFNVTLCLIIYV